MTNLTFQKNALGLAMLLLPCWVLGQEATQKAASGGNWINLELNTVLLAVAIVLLLPLYWSGQTLLFAAREKMRQQKSIEKPLLVLFFLLGCSSIMSAQTESIPVKSGGAESAMYTIVLFCVIALEVFLISVLSRLASGIFRPALPVVDIAPESAGKKAFQRFWEKINSFKPLEQESDIDTGHNYDGIRELDNITPPWFTAAFACTILFAIVYLWRYHVSESAPLQIEEYEIAMAQAEEEEAAMLASQANKVDESTVVMLGASDIEKGGKIFAEKCAACHAAHGGSMPGGVGPNLTDEYWLHGGSLKDIFKTIKYGWPDKGMISWKDQLSPNQIAQAASFIKSVRGSNPAGAKEAQGDLYTEEAAAVPDSTTVHK